MRLREMEQKELERKYGKKKAKEVAQQNFEVELINLQSDLKGFITNIHIYYPI